VAKKRKVSAKQRAAARRNIKKAHAARRCRTKLKKIRHRKARRNPIAAAAAEAKRKSAKRVRAGKKAARTRKRNAGKRSGARKSPRRGKSSRAAKKAARTRARNKARRRAAARKGARKRSATRAYHRSSMSHKSYDYNKDPYAGETRRRRRKRSKHRKNPIPLAAAAPRRRRRRSSKRRVTRRRRKNPIAAAAPRRRKHRHHGRRRNPIGNPLVGGHVANPITGPAEFAAGVFGVAFGFGLASLGDRLIVTHALSTATPPMDAPAQGQIYNTESVQTALWSNFSTLGWKRMAMAFGAVVLPLGAAHVVRQHMALKSFFQLAGFGALGRTAGKMFDDGVAQMLNTNATAQRLYAPEIAATAKLNASNLAAPTPAVAGTFAGLPQGFRQPPPPPPPPVAAPRQFAGVPQSPQQPQQEAGGYVQPPVPAPTSMRYHERVNFHLMNPDGVD
jgi:hypothetical protein